MACSGITAFDLPGSVENSPGGSGVSAETLAVISAKQPNNIEKAVSRHGMFNF
jgi:hypothetical protein